MESNLARNVFSRILQNTKKPDSGPASLSVEDAKSLREVASEIIRRDKEGIRSHWGPRIPDLNKLCEVILSDEQLKVVGQRKSEVAQAILDAIVVAEQNSPTEAQLSEAVVTQGVAPVAVDTPPAKRTRISTAEEEFLEEQLRLFRRRNAIIPSPWDKYLQPEAALARAQKSLSWPCPLLADRRGTFLAGRQELIRDLQKQSQEVEKWSSISVGDGTLLSERAKELSAVLAELAQESEPFPPSVPATVIAKTYKLLLNNRVKELQLEEANAQVSHPVNSVRVAVASPVVASVPHAKSVRFAVSSPVEASSAHSVATANTSAVRSLFTVSSPVAPAALNSRAAETFASITGRSVAPTNSESHLEDCCFLVAAHDKRKKDLVGRMGIRIERPVPAAALQIISKRMAPVGSLLDSASSLFPGKSSEAAEQRSAVSTVLNEVFDQANVVAVERINRGSATQRKQRLADGAAMSEQQRQDSMKRESIALSRIAVLARMIACGVDSLAKLQLSTETPQLAKDIMAMSGMDLTSATSAAKAVLSAAVSQKQFKKAEDKRKAQVAAIARKKALDSMRRYGGGRGHGKGRGRARGRGRGRGGRGKRHGSQNKRPRACHRCGATDHLAKDCPQPPANASNKKS